MLADKTFVTPEWQTFSARTEFSGAADTLVATYSDAPKMLRIAPYEVNLLAWGKRRAWGRKGRGDTGLSSELRTLEAYLQRVRRAENGEMDEQVLAKAG